jgi:hypothetical protein
MTAPQTTSASYEVGYRKPPRHTQFQKGQSGNPGGRPRRSLAGRLEELALHEAYRTTVVMEDGHAMPMPVIQAVLRRQLESAAGGNVRAQRDILAMIRDIEQARSITAMFEDGDADDVVNDTDDADAIDGDDNDVDDTADADRDDAGGADDDEPARQQADGIDTYSERREAEREPTAPPAVGASGGGNEELLSSPSPTSGRAGVGPSPRHSAPRLQNPTRPRLRSATLPEDGEGETLAAAPQPENAAAPPAGWTPSLPSRAGSGQRARAASSCRGEGPTPALHPKSGLPDFGAKHVEFGDSRIRLDGEGEVARASFPPRGVQPARPQPGRRRRGPAVNAGKIRGGRSGGSRRSPGRRNADPARPRLQAGTPARRPPLPNETKN